MPCSVWILEEDDDNRQLALECLAHAGFEATGFSCAASLLEHAPGVRAPTTLVVDAQTACGHEAALRDALPSRLVVLTTWPTQLVPWMRLGASRFLLKPYSVDTLIDHVVPPPRMGPGIRTRSTRRMRRAA